MYLFKLMDISVWELRSWRVNRLEIIERNVDGVTNAIPCETNAL